MNMMSEPPINPHDDTSPSITISPVDDRSKDGLWRRRIAWLSLFGAFALTVATIALLLTGDPAPSEQPVSAVATATESQPEPTQDIPTVTPTIETLADEAAVQLVSDAPPLPTLAPDQIDNLLLTPFVPEVETNLPLDPFTISPPRARSEFVEYTVARGDTIDAIARRFNLEPESIAWCNDRRVIFVLRPGDVLQIPPVDGACHIVLGTRELTLGDIADEYQLEDPFTMIDSPYNSLFGRAPDYVPPGGTRLFIPGGQGELVTWNPGTEREVDASGNVRSLAFAPGQPGSCGQVTATGGTVWGNPLPNGTWVRGFFAGHTGIDLAAPTGTPIYAANGGPVLFSGFSRWGYGEAVVLGHGPILSTLYGHMNQRNVSCGQVVNTGSIIGLVGSTGQSSGPHLHFEIRVNDTPQDPTLTGGVGW